MHILKRLSAAILLVALFIPTITSAAIVMPALEIQLSTGDSGAIWSTTDTGFDFDIGATVFQIVNEDTGTSINLPNQAFTLHASFDSSANFIEGNFIAGDYLSGDLTNMLVQRLPGSGSLDFEADLIYTAGSLMGSLDGGRIEGIGGAAKLGTVVVPVPAAAWLFGTGLIALIGIARRKA